MVRASLFLSLTSRSRSRLFRRIPLHAGLAALHQSCSALAAGEPSDLIKGVLFASRGAALKKPDGKIRPICVTGILRKITSGALMAQYKDVIVARLEESHQYGLSRSCRTNSRVAEVVAPANGGVRRGRQSNSQSPWRPWQSSAIRAVLFESATFVSHKESLLS